MAMTSKAKAHVIVSALWAVFSIVFGISAIIYHFDSLWTGVTLIACIAGNSASGIAFHLSKEGIEIQSEKKS